MPQAPHHRHPLQQKSSLTGAEVGRAMGRARIARRLPNVETVNQRPYFDWRRPRATRQRFANTQLARLIAQAVFRATPHDTRRRSGDRAHSHKHAALAAYKDINNGTRLRHGSINIAGQSRPGISSYMTGL